MADPRSTCSMCFFFFALIINVHKCRFCRSSLNAIPNNRGEQPRTRRQSTHPSSSPLSSCVLRQSELMWYLYTTKELCLSSIPFIILIFSVINQYGKNIQPVQQLCSQNSLGILYLQSGNCPVNTDLVICRLKTSRCLG